MAHNRTHPLKEDTFVLDFVNDRKEIREASKAYYESAVMNAALDSAVSRFAALQREKEEEAELFRGKVQAFRNPYTFLG